MTDYAYFKAHGILNSQSIFATFNYNKSTIFSAKYSHFLKRDIKAVFVDSVTLVFLWSSDYKVLMNEELDRL